MERHLHDKPTARESLAINYAKAMGIVMVVIGHYHGSLFDFYRPYTFHMPLFFFIGGLLLDPRAGARKFYAGIARKHVLYAVSTYLVVGSMAVLFRNGLGADIQGDPFNGSIREILLANYESNFEQNTYFLVLWFIVCYAATSSALFPIIKATREWRFSSAVYVLAILALGYLGMETFADRFHEGKDIGFNYLSQICTASAFYLAGYVARPFLWRSLSLYGFIAAFFVMYVSSRTGFDHAVVMAWSKYPDGFVMSFLRIFCGIYSTFYLSWVLSSERMELFETAGRESKAIMSYHLIGYLFLDLVFHTLGLYDIRDATPLDHFSSPVFSPLYIILPTLMPIACAICYRKAKAGLYSKAKVEISRRLVPR
ncbi:acyltransferase family protein [uncultured Castellaniella sp.]|uniref:acyltransferase family protein n=1 Tax=uncultured Castellaniella sp. TaxID=647907 RepID=UPI002631A9F7|nr:acyltransferase family protein [uncultured Castellaniella sp.]